MYDQLASDLSIDITKKDSALANFVAYPEKCFSKINNLINQGKSDLDIDGSASLDLKICIRVLIWKHLRSFQKLVKN